VANREELEALSSEELYKRARKRARHHADVKFFWDLLEDLPAAEAAAGEVDEALTDVQSLYGHVDDLKTLKDPQVLDELRPFFLDYLEKHS
jgi:hypothetical protein